MGDVMGDLQGRRAMIMGMSSEAGYEKLIAKVPLKEIDVYKRQPWQLLTYLIRFLLVKIEEKFYFCF